MAEQLHDRETEIAPREEERERDQSRERDERTRRASGKPLRASPFSWETASRVRPPWRR